MINHAINESNTLITIDGNTHGSVIHIFHSAKKTVNKKKVIVCHITLVFEKN